MRQEIKPPTPFAKRFVRMVLGFGVGIGVGLAPFLGKIGVPGFSALLSLFPDTLKNFLVPTSAFLMGLVAAVTQFYAGTRMKTNRTTKIAWRTLLVTVAFFFLLIVSYFLLVARVSFPGRSTVPVVTGLERSSSCSCSKDMSDSQCIFEISANPNSIETCWGTLQVHLSELTLSSLYLGLCGSFALFIGMLIIHEGQTTRSSFAKSRKKVK